MFPSIFGQQRGLHGHVSPAAIRNLWGWVNVKHHNDLKFARFLTDLNSLPSFRFLRRSFLQQSKLLSFLRSNNLSSGGLKLRGSINKISRVSCDSMPHTKPHRPDPSPALQEWLTRVLLLTKAYAEECAILRSFSIRSLPCRELLTVRVIVPFSTSSTILKTVRLRKVSNH